MRREGESFDQYAARMDAFLKKLEAQPMAKERAELGTLLMRHIENLTKPELDRYNELNRLLAEHDAKTTPHQ